MRRAIILIIAAALLAGCATGGGGGAGARHAVRYPNAVSPEVQAQFNAAEDLYMRRAFTEADAALSAFIGQAPYTELTDVARFLRGEIAFIKRSYAAAVTFYRSAYGEIASPKVEPKARFKAAMALTKQGKKAEAVQELSGINRPDATALLRLRADSLGAAASTAADTQPPQILWYLWLLDDYADGADPAKVSSADDRVVSEADARAKVKRWVDDRSVTLQQVEALPLAQMKGRESGGYALYKQALLTHSAGDTAQATKLLKSYTSAYSKHEYYASARALMGELGGVVGDVSGVAIGVILPLSGKNAVFGESVLHGIECAVGIYEPCVGPSGIRLVVRDGNSFPGGAAAAVEDLANDKDVIAIVGPLQSAQVVGAAAAAQGRAIPLISLSQREEIVGTGEYVFRNSASAGSEMTTLVDYAVGDKGLKRFFVLYPNSKKGQEYFRLFSRAAKERGGNIVASRSYSPRQVQVVSELRGRGAVEMAEMRGDAGVELAVGAAYDAIFIPDAFWAANSIAQQMALSENAGKTQFLGISRWNDPEQVRRAEYMGGAIFVDSFYKEAPEAEVSAFTTRMRQAYGMEPTLLEALGYDTARIIADAAGGRGARSRDSMRSAIARTADFPGVAGRTSFNEQGDAVRKMWVLTISGGQIRAAK